LRSGNRCLEAPDASRVWSLDGQERLLDIFLPDPLVDDVLVPLISPLHRDRGPRKRTDRRHLAAVTRRIQG